MLLVPGSWLLVAGYLLVGFNILVFAVKKINCIKTNDGKQLLFTGVKQE